MTAVDWWMVLLFFAGPVGLVARYWRKDVAARITAEARATAAETEAAQWKHRAGQLEDYLARIPRSVPGPRGRVSD